MRPPQGPMCLHDMPMSHPFHVLSFLHQAIESIYLAGHVEIGGHKCQVFEDLAV